MEELNTDILKSPGYNDILEPKNSKEKDAHDRIREYDEMQGEEFVNSVLDEADM